MKQPAENAVLVRFPLNFPLALVAILANKHGYQMKWVRPPDLDVPARLWEVMSKSQYSVPGPSLEKVFSKIPEDQRPLVVEEGAPPQWYGPGIYPKDSPDRGEPMETVEDRGEPT